MTDEKTPYWRVHYGMGSPWITGVRGRRGCMVMLVSAFALFVLVLIIGVVASFAG
jgi:hypothetical protein